MRILIYLIFSINATLLFSQNSLRFSNVNGIPFSVYLNDSLINSIMQTDILISGIKKDTVLVKLDFENKLSATKKIYLLDKRKKVKNYEFVYLVEIENNKINFNFAGSPTGVNLPSPLIPYKPKVDTSLKYKNNILEHYVEMKNHNPIYFNNIPSDGLCKTPMPESYLNYMKILMHKAQTEDDKFKIAKNTTRNNCISVAQMNVILSFIPFEIEKLKLIKSSFASITDKKEKNKLDSTIKLESTKNELINMLKNADDNLRVSSNNCLGTATEMQLNEMKKNLSVYANDAERLNALNNVYEDHCYSLEQVRGLIKLFFHDREKLESAKMLYFYCVEQANYQNLSTAFSYSTTSAELTEFIEKQKK